MFMSVRELFKSKITASRMRPALFMHIQKTAGTSLVMAAGRHYGWDGIVSHGGYVGRDPKEFEEFDFVSGHFGFSFAKELIEKRYSFTFLRCPIERVLSFYYFCRKRDPEELPIYRIAQSHDLSSFLDLARDEDLVRQRVWNSQAWRLADGPGFHDRGVDELPPDKLLKAALVNAEKFSFVGFTETFAHDAEVVSSALGFPKEIRPGRDNVTEGRLLAKDHPAELVRKIENITELDRFLYNTLWSRMKG